ncbi:MAG: uroporphyrinogen-III C-methyltransferase [Tepidisphaeraceae bacterium]
MTDTPLDATADSTPGPLGGGSVALVGAGPGDPGLITVRGAELLRQADVVGYDALSSPRLLAHAPQAEHIYVGKVASRHSMTQDQINALLVERGRAGQRVVRLKGGDPFVFGRGGEEAEVLTKAGLTFVVVPGITAAIAAPAYAGIPVTHRDFNSSFTLITGHEKEEKYLDAEAKTRDRASGSSDLDWSAIAKLPCFAFYMGIKSLPRSEQRLIDHGLDPATPAATIQWGTTPRQRTCVATIATLADAIARAGIGSPAITIVGKVVTLRDTLNWFESRPLFGQTVVVTRTRDQASALSEQLEALGARVIEAPTIETTPVHDTARVDAALQSLFSSPAGLGSDKSWLVFTSANGVRATRDRMRELKHDARSLAGVKVAVIGEATANAVRELLGIEPDCVPKAFVAEALAQALIDQGAVAGARFVLLRADIARPVLVEKLQAAGAASVEDVSVYETRPATALPVALLQALDAGEVDWITFTSSSTAKNLLDLLGPARAEAVRAAKLASIGPITSAALRERGYVPTVEADVSDVDGLVRAVRSYSK